MSVPYQNREVDILLARYGEHAQHMRHLDLFDIRVAGGFLTVQLVFGSWFATHPIDEAWVKIALLGIDFALLVVCTRIIKSSRDRREEVRQTIQNINHALGLDEKGTYLHDRPINPDRPARRFRWYEYGCVVAYAAVVLLIWVSHGATTGS